ncbi:acyl-CoA thioesterase [Pseudochrobactrum asaccharolyticum]|uniref:acyl-CoA thioesterase n=1 Tax=Pseudochrobactrum asaccharolyticum TaxID=354351 RepID=UPI0040438A6B
MVFRTTRPLRFGDCDPSGIAYFPSYLNILIGVLEDFFASIGADWKTLNQQRQIATPTVRLDLTFVKPGFHADQLEFTLKVMAVGCSSLSLEHEVHANGDLLWSAKHKIVATSMATHKACAWPDDIRAALSNHLETQNA